MTIPFQRVAIIGFGLIGSSIARALHEVSEETPIVGYDANEVSLAFAKKHGLLQRAATSAADAVIGCDLVLLATPPATLGGIAEEIAATLEKNALVMDVASVKQAAMSAIEPHIPPHVRYIPAHPIAGSERSGVAAGTADLFVKRRVILTPKEPLPPELWQRAAQFWQSLGARAEAMPPELHDQVYGLVSHLPQLLAFAAASAAEGYKLPDDDTFLSFSRLWRSDADLWADIFTQNHTALTSALSRYLDALTHIISELKSAPADAPVAKKDPALVLRLFSRIAASCLITTVMEAERQLGLPLARYGGSGFADFTAPTQTPAEDDIEHIANHHAEVLKLLEAYRDALLSTKATSSS